MATESDAAIAASRIQAARSQRTATVCCRGAGKGGAPSRLSAVGDIGDGLKEVGQALLDERQGRGIDQPAIFDLCLD